MPWAFPEEGTCDLNLEAVAGDADALEREETEFRRPFSAGAGDAPVVPMFAFVESPVTDVAIVVVPTVPRTLEVLLKIPTAAALVGEEGDSVEANFRDDGVDDLVGCCDNDGCDDDEGEVFEPSERDGDAAMT